MERPIEIAGDMIRLGQLLKLAGAAGGGADAKALIASGQVTVNREPELRRGRQLHPGDVVHVGTHDLRVVPASVNLDGSSLHEDHRSTGDGAPAP